MIGKENMEKPVAAIEFGSKKLKLVVGYEIGGQVYILYALTKPYGHMIESGTIVDQQTIAKAINEVRTFSEPSLKLKVSISEALLALPPYGLEIFQTKQVTTVLSDEAKIGNIDIRNIYSLIKNGALPLDNQLIDVAPERYILDQGRSFIKPPLNETSSTLTVIAKVHTLPKRVAGEYKAAFNAGGLSIKRSIVAPFGACELLGSYPDIPNDYLLVDIGSDITTVSFIGDKELYASRFFSWGGDRITERIIESFNINETDAEKYKITYGIDTREMAFKTPVCSVDDGQGHEIKHYVDELNAIIKSELDIFLKELEITLNDLLKGYDPSAKQLPMILIGGGSHLNGLVEYIEPKVQSETVKVVSPRTLGARNPTFTNCLGMILANAKCTNIYDESHPKVTPLSRDENK